MRIFSRSHLGLLLVLLLVFTAGLGLSTTSHGVVGAAGPQIWLSQKVGPPTANMQVNGYGFGHSETVLVDFSSTQVGKATTDTTGKFVIRITLPKSAFPGTHKVRATGQSTGLTAQTHFLVRTDWSQFLFGPHHAGYNPYENILSSSNVSDLTLDWSYATGNGIHSSPAIANGVVYIGSTSSTYTNGYLHAIDAMTGTLKWSYASRNGGGDSYPSSSPALANGIVYVGSGDGVVYAFHLPGMS
jgi:outer membrane protein assembly factor BamB